MNYDLIVLAIKHLESFSAFVDVEVKVLSGVSTNRESVFINISTNKGDHRCSFIFKKGELISASFDGKAYNHSPESELIWLSQ